MKWWARGVLIAGAPALSCGTWGPGCPRPEVVTWDGGRFATGADGGLDCLALCGLYDTFFPDSGYVNGTCSFIDAGVATCQGYCTGGRAPPGLERLSRVDGSAGSYVARMAELERASVRAFEQLALELDAHGLDDLAHHARDAALDEVRHGDAMTRLALSLGRCPAPVKIAPPNEVRSLEEIALDNAAEGCGRELFGATQNQWQATHATEERVRSLMASIARDEHRHADYAFALAKALNSRLTAVARRRAREAQEAMLRQIGEDAPRHTRRFLGLMDPEQVCTTAKALLETHRV